MVERRTQSPGEIQRREVSWTLTMKLHTFAGPGEIKRREVGWTLTKKLHTFAGPGEIKRREVSWTLTKKLHTFAGSGEIKRRAVSGTLAKKLDFHLRVQARSRAGRRSLAQKVGLVFCFGCSSTAVPRTLSL